MRFFLQNLRNYDALIKKNTVIELLVGSESRKKVKLWEDLAKEVSLKYGIDIYLEIRPSNFIERLAMADLAILSGGLTIFDAVSLGIPSIGLPQYDHQLKTIIKLKEKMALQIGSEGMRLDHSFFLRSFNKLMTSKNTRMSLKNIGPILIDRKGNERVINILSAYIN